MNWRSTFVLAAIVLAVFAYFRFFELKQPGAEHGQLRSGQNRWRHHSKWRRKNRDVAPRQQMAPRDADQRPGRRFFDRESAVRLGELAEGRDDSGKRNRGRQKQTERVRPEQAKAEAQISWPG